MSAKYLLTPLADRDLEEILEYVHRQSPQNAIKVLDDLHAGMRRLAAMPRLGHHREDLRKSSYRVWCVDSYLIIYDPETTPITISRIVRGTRDLRRLFRFE